MDAAGNKVSLADLDLSQPEAPLNSRSVSQRAGPSSTAGARVSAGDLSQGSTGQPDKDPDRGKGKAALYSLILEWCIHIDMT